MKCTLKPAIIVALLALASSLQAAVIWYNGDANGNGSLVSQVDTGGNFTARTYDDFTLGSGFTVNEIFGQFVFQDSRAADFTTASWEIRSGISTGNSGTLVASGTGAMSKSSIGSFGIGTQLYSISIPSLNFVLNPGTYWINVSPVFGGSGGFAAFAASTVGPNSVGSPGGNNGNSFIIAPSAGYNSMTPVFDALGNGTYDYSLGIAGDPVGGNGIPEPGTLALLAIGTLGLLAARRRP